MMGAIVVDDPVVLAILRPQAAWPSREHDGHRYLSRHGFLLFVMLANNESASIRRRHIRTNTGCVTERGRNGCRESSIQLISALRLPTLPHQAIRRAPRYVGLK